MKIRTKLILTLLITIALPLTALVVADFFLSKNSLERSSLDSLRVFVEGKGSQILEYLTQKKGRVRDLAASDFVDVSVSSARDKDAMKQLNMRLRRLREHDPDIEKVQVYTLSGDVFASTDETEIGTRTISDQALLAKGKERTYVRDIFKHAPSEEGLLFSISAPIMTQNAITPSGILSVSYHIRHIQDILSGMRGKHLGALPGGEEETGHINTYLINEDEIIIGGSRDGSTAVDINPEPVRLCREEMREITQQWTNNGSLPVWGASECLPIEEGLTWVLIAEQRNDIALSSVVELRNLSILLLTFALFVSGGIVLFIARSISRPIQILQEGTEIIGNGNLDHRVGSNAKDEIGILSRAFDVMTERLKDATASREELNREIEERKMAEEKILQSRHTLETILDSMPFGVVIIGRDKTIRHVNNSALSLIGLLSPDDLIGKHCNSVFCPAETGQCPVLDLHERLDRSERILVTADGRRVPILKSALAVTLNNEEVLLEAFVDITERKIAERQLNFLASIVKSIPDAVCSVDIKGTLTSWNKGAEKMLGYRESEILGKPMLTFVPEVLGQAKVEQYLNRLKTEGAVSGYESLRVARDGRIIPVELTGVVLKDEKSNITGYASIMRDITERKKADEKISRLNRLYSLLSEINQMIVRASDKSMLFREACRIAVEHGLFKMAWIGIIDEETSIMKPAAHWGKEDGYLESIKVCLRDIPAAKGPIGKALNDGNYFVCNDIADGNDMLPWKEEALKRAYRSVAAIPLRTENIIVGVMCFYSGRKDFFDDDEVRLLEELATDISFALDFMEKEERRRQSEEFIKNIFESMGEGLIVIDRGYRILSANREYCEQIGQTTGDIIGKCCYHVSHQSDKPCHEEGEECPSLKTFETGEPQSAIHKHCGGDSDPVYIEIRTFPMKNSSGEVFSVIEVTNNITEKLKLEEQLRHAQKMEAIGTLAGGIAHDFNNILNAIIGFASLIEMDLGRTHPVQGYLSEIASASERATQLTKSLLAFSRKQTFDLRPVDLNDIVRRMEKFLVRLIGEDINFKTILSDDDIELIADSRQIEQVLMNLATNARDAMKDGGSLTIKTEKVTLDTDFIKAHGYGKVGNYALVTMADTGQGIDEETCGKIFEPFFTTKEAGKGTGLGLSIVYGIIKQHKGYIDVVSQIGRGTTFGIYLPLTGKKTSMDRKLQKENVSPLPGGSETILVAEDDKTLRKLMITTLTQFGYKVIDAVDGEDAIEKFIASPEKIHLLVLDLIMPKKNGKKAYDEIKEIRSDIKCIMLSGYTADILTEKGIMERGINFVTKPVSPIDLLKKVRNVLDDHMTG